MKLGGKEMKENIGLVNPKALPWTLKTQSFLRGEFNPSMKVGLEQLYLGLQKKAKAIRTEKKKHS